MDLKKKKQQHIFKKNIIFLPHKINCINFIHSFSVLSEIYLKSSYLFFLYCVIRIYFPLCCNLKRNLFINFYSIYFRHFSYFIYSLSLIKRKRERKNKHVIKYGIKIRMVCDSNEIICFCHFRWNTCIVFIFIYGWMCVW